MASKPLISSSKNLLPPLILYRKILRVHRYLPPSLRSLGDDYVKSEFRRHKDITNPLHIIGFLNQWQVYLKDIKQQVVNSTLSKEVKFGKKIETDVLEKFSEQQVGQLYALRNETKSVIK
ncbi:1802_t:CDS:1 [Diversispora eburnea]|uniref:Succinate dehydrogenase assembly factor 3 n=1 Tax=Diversispora eburnea TaxID=1213867 RepID=A0A9N8Z0N2_9GLOM|nr:1802_t:CDS:1 [Diversispora eburnea]